MTLGDLAERLIALFDRFRIPYMFVGSVASSFHGEPRMTRDLDIVIDPSPDGLAGLVGALVDAGFYADADAANQALADRSQFNVIDPTSGWKADLIIRKERPFSREEFARRQPADLLGGSAFVATVEDSIISKLEWARAGESERQLRDVAAILAVWGESLDRPYVDRWVRELGLQDMWRRVTSGRLRSR
jgi:hypothetical protein